MIYFASQLPMIEPIITLDIPQYLNYISSSVLLHQFKIAEVIPSVEPELKIVGGVPNPYKNSLESIEALQFVVRLYERVKNQLREVLERRERDRIFIDEQTKACNEENSSFNRSYRSPQFRTIIGLKDSEGRVVVGKNNPEHDLRQAYGAPVRDIPHHLRGEHVTLFGPPDSTKLCINAMNALHRKIPNEPNIIEELVNKSSIIPKWGADDEDSKTPLRDQLLLAANNLNACFEGTIECYEAQTGRYYKLEREKLSLPIKRIPGLSLPSVTHFVRNSPLPLHIYDFAIHLYHQWNREEALSFYVPKLENEEEASYIRFLIVSAEHLIKEINPQYKIGTVSVLVVLENPRAIFRLNEIMDNLYPYFIGASLGWHDYLASTARLFKEDSFYRIPIKVDPNIVIRHIKESHILLAQVVGKRGGIKIGGMYGVLPTSRELESPSFQISIIGFIKDVVTQFKRGLNGFWVAHPDFVRIGIALIEAWKEFENNHENKSLENLVCQLVLDQQNQESLLNFIHSPDIEGLNHEDPLYERALLAADILGSNEIENNNPKEIRYNIFQSLQYIADWLSGNGCVALPASIFGVNVRIMDDLATTERSRWEVWHEIYHQRISIELFLSLLLEEYTFIKNNLRKDDKIIQVKWDKRTSKWYPCALKLLIILMTSRTPVEFATELLLIFTISTVREADDPWKMAMTLERRFEGDLSPNDLPSSKFYIPKSIQTFINYYSCFPNVSIAKKLSSSVFLYEEKAKKLMNSLEYSELIRTRDYILNIECNKEISFISTQEEIINFGLKRLCASKYFQEDQFMNQVKDLLKLFKVPGISISISNGLNESIENISLGYSNVEKSILVQDSTLFEVASISKTIAAAFTIEYFGIKGLQTRVNLLLEKYNSPYRLKSKEGLPNEWADEITIKHLMNNTALNMHYVYGISLDDPTPNILDLIKGNEKYGYNRLEVFKSPGKIFHYSGGSFMILQYLLELIEKKNIEEIIRPFLDALGMKDFTFYQQNINKFEYAFGYKETGEQINSYGRLQFPALSAGGISSSSSIQKFLNHLTVAYNRIEGSSVISHNSACELLYSEDHGSMEFIGAKMGLGIFVVEAEENRFAIHQAANDGFRGLYCHCFRGPDIGKGFTILSNSDVNGIIFISYVSQLLLKGLNVSGVDFNLFKDEFDYSRMKSEEAVNYCYKEMIFKAFKKNSSPVYNTLGPNDPLSTFNLSVGSRIISVTDDTFASASNLLSPCLPLFDPNAFGPQGKIMDSWESRRHSLLGRDILHFALKASSTIKYILVSTEFHIGNQAEFVEIEGLNTFNNSWITILPKSKLDGHSIHRYKVPEKMSQIVFSEIKVHNIPDGGITRLGIFNNNLPDSEKELFETINVTQCSSIVPILKNTRIKYIFPTFETIKKNWDTILNETVINVASGAIGARFVYCSNEHFGPGASVISPFSPISMFDGFESARSRNPNHRDYIVIQLAAVSKIESIELDFTYFRNNNPKYISISAYDENDIEFEIVEEIFAKPYAGNKLIMKSMETERFATRMKVVCIPDGGFNRLKVFAKYFKRPFIDISKQASQERNKVYQVYQDIH